MSSENPTPDPPAEDTFKILVATDNHLGYNEKDPIRGNDSFRAFEEILQIAGKTDADMILLGGDLFHEANPSTQCISKCIQLLRKYCVGDKEVPFQFLSDPKVNFSHLSEPVVNYEDSNINISIPVFSIHGNHDDPTGTEQISALNILANTSLLNYFGKQESVTDVMINPLLMSKGNTKLAIYGLSHLRDERLGRLFLNKQIIFGNPDGEDWFHLMVLHQNRCERGPKKYVPTSYLPKFLNLVVWGHEHDSYPTPIDDNGIKIIQPGSSVATSLARGESLPKHVVLLQIYKTKFKLTPIKLETVRPFLYAEMHLDDPDPKLYSSEGRPAEQAMASIEKTMNGLLKKCSEESKGTIREKMLPLIRLVVSYSDSRQTINTIKFNQRFNDKVANPLDTVVLKLYSKSAKRQKKIGLSDIGDDIEEAQGRNWAIEEVIGQYLEKVDMTCLQSGGLLSALREFVHESNKDAFNKEIEQMKEALEKLMTLDPSEDDLPKVLNDMRESAEGERPRNQNEEDVIPTSPTTNIIAIDSDDDHMSPEDDAGSSSRGKTPRGGRGARASRRSRGRRGRQ